MKNTEQCKEAIDKFIEHSIIKCPENKIKNIGTDESKRDDSFCIFIMSYGRPDNNRTWKTLMEYEGVSLNQDVYLICSDDDKHLDGYIEKFGDRVLVFNKKSMIPYIDKADNFEKYGVILYARNICFAFAKKLGYRYFVELDDDYDIFSQRIFYDNSKLMMEKIKDYDKLFAVHLKFLKTVPVKTITMAQHGDFMGGVGNGNAIRGYQRKVMNSFFCDIENPFLFDGTINEDVNYYTQSGLRGILNFNLFGFSLNQETTQASAGGMTEQYLSGGTYLKSFYTLLFCPGSVKIGKISHGANARMHHQVNSNATYPKILDEKYSKHKYSELYNDNW